MTVPFETISSLAKQLDSDMSLHGNWWKMRLHELKG